MTINQIPPGLQNYRFPKSQATCSAGTLRSMRVFPKESNGQRRVTIDMVVNDGFSIAQCINGLSEDVNNVKPKKVIPEPHRKITFRD